MKTKNFELAIPTCDFIGMPDGVLEVFSINKELEEFSNKFNKKVKEDLTPLEQEAIEDTYPVLIEALESEKEAVMIYEEMINIEKEADKPNDDVIDLLAKILVDEKEHIALLSAMQAKLTKQYVADDAESDFVDVSESASTEDVVNDKDVIFDYAIINFMEKSSLTQYPGNDKLRKFEEDKTKFRNLDHLGDIIYEADREAKTAYSDIGGGSDELYVDFYGKTKTGDTVKIHGTQWDLGYALDRSQHLSNSDIPEIEDMLNEEYYA